MPALTITTNTQKRLGYVCNPRSLKEATETSRIRILLRERPIHFECKLNKPMHIGMIGTRCLTDRIQLHTKKSDPLHRGEFFLFPFDPKAQLAEVREHQIPVFA